MQKILLTLALILSLATLYTAKATHFAGGEITYLHISGNTYLVTWKFYRDCAGIEPTQEDKELRFQATGVDFIITMNEVSRTELSPLCPGQLSTCSGGSFPGIQEIVYQGTVTLNLNAGVYTISQSRCCRNHIITTLNNPGGTGWYITTSIDPNLIPRNSSPVFLNPPVVYACAGQFTSISPNAFDADGDALLYSLTTCQQVGLGGSTVSPVVYNPGFSPTNPLATTSGITVNPITGLITFTPSVTQVGVFCILVEEFRNGIKIGEIVRDIQVQVTACSNLNPVIAPIPNITVQVGASVSIPVFATDADNDLMNLTAISGLIPPATFTQLTNNPGVATGQFNFTATAAQQGQTYTVTIQATDIHCPIVGFGVTTFNIFVPIPCNLSASAVGANESPAGANNGSVNLTVSNFTPPLSFFWSGPNGYSASTEDISGLAPGQYCVLVLDGANCFDTTCVTIGTTSVPFACDGKLYQTINPGGVYGLYEVTTNPVAFNLVSSLASLTTGINSIAFNPSDNFIYGINPSSPYELYRIDGTGAPTYLGNISGLAGNVFAGGMDFNGDYYVTGSGPLYRININTLSATLVGNTGRNIADIALNPADGQLYGWALGSGQRRLVRINPLSAVTVNVGPQNNQYDVFGALYFNAQGDIIAYGDNVQNGVGQETLVKIDPNTGVVSFLGTGPSVAANDGCSCSFGIELTKAASVSSVVAGSGFTYTFTLFNQSNVTLNNLSFSDLLCGGALWNSEPQNQIGLTVSGPAITGTGNANLIISNVAPGQSSFTIEVLTAACTCGEPCPNQALLSGLPGSFGGSILSDDPVTAAITDPTIVQITGETVAPIINCPADLTILCNQSADTSATGVATGSDLCSAVSIAYSDSIVSGSCDYNYVINRRWTATDACGNIAACIQHIHVLDTIAPVIVAPAMDLVVQCDGLGNLNALNTWKGNQGGAQATDVCGFSSSSILWGDFSPGGYVALCGGTGYQDVVFTITDACGNSASDTARFTIIDTLPPSIICPSDLTILCHESSDTSATGAATATDLCSGVTITYFDHTTLGSCLNEYVIARTWTATDACGNFLSCIQTINVVDTIAPVIVVPALDLTVQCDGSGNLNAYNTWTTTQGGAQATDNCPFAPSTILWADFTTGFVSLCGSTGYQDVMFTITDACGNSTRDTARFTIIDTIAPTILSQAANLTLECDGGGNGTALTNWLTNNGGAAASDLCGNVTWSNNFGGLSDLCGATGAATVTFYATDACGNVDSTTATFTIEDTTVPAVVAGMNMTVECDGAGNGTELNIWLSSNAGASASDVCGGVTWANNFSALSDLCGATGAATVTFYATDDCGNADSTSAVFTIEDPQSPTVVCPADIVLSACDSVATWVNSASDACDANPTINCSIASGSVFANGTTTTIYCVAKDECGNTDSCSFTVARKAALDMALCSPGQCIALGYSAEGSAQISVASTSGGQPNYSILWSTGETTDTIVYTPDSTIVGDTTIVISVTVADADGCTTSATHNIHVADVRCPKSSSKSSKSGSKSSESASHSSSKTSKKSAKSEKCELLMCKPVSQKSSKSSKATNKSGKTSKSSKMKLPTVHCVPCKYVPDLLAKGWTLGDCSSSCDFDGGACGEPAQPLVASSSKSSKSAKSSSSKSKKFSAKLSGKSAKSTKKSAKSAKATGGKKTGSQSSLGDKVAMSMQVVPNPNNGQFNIRLNNIDQTESMMIEIYDLQGKRVFKAQYHESQSQIAIDLIAVPNGVYMVKVLVGSELHMKQVVKY